MLKTLDTLNNIILEMKIIQLQLHLAKRSNKLLQTSKDTQTATQIHINHSLHNLDNLITTVNDYKVIIHKGLE